MPTWFEPCGTVALLLLLTLVILFIAEATR